MSSITPVVVLSVLMVLKFTLLAAFLFTAILPAPTVESLVASNVFVVPPIVRVTVSSSVIVVPLDVKDNAAGLPTVGG